MQDTREYAASSMFGRGRGSARVEREPHAFVSQVVDDSKATVGFAQMKGNPIKTKEKKVNFNMTSFLTQVTDAAREESGAGPVAEMPVGIRFPFATLCFADLSGEQAEEADVDGEVEEGGGRGSVVHHDGRDSEREEPSVLTHRTAFAENHHAGERRGTS